MSDDVIYNFCTGKPMDVVSDVLRSISAYSRVDRAANFKIGITNNPEQRFRAAYSNYDKMIAVYSSDSIKNIRDMEKLLVFHNNELCDNIIAGGGGNFGNPPYYLYVVIKSL